MCLHDNTRQINTLDFACQNILVKGLFGEVFYMLGTIKILLNARALI